MAFVFSFFHPGGNRTPGERYLFKSTRPTPAIDRIAKARDAVYQYANLERII
jgi:hypothetical protein